MNHLETPTQKFENLQKELKEIETSINYVEKTDIQKERISQKLNDIMKRIDEDTTNKAEKLKAKEIVKLTQQVEHIALAVGIKTSAELTFLKTGIITEYERPPQVLKEIEASSTRARTKIEEMQSRPIIWPFAKRILADMK